MTIQNFAEKIRDLAGTGSKIVLRELPEDDPKVRQPDITKARRILDNWEPKVQLDEGLARTIDYFKKKLAS
jgi:nucleoside-diphosphate-sugar epimerase